MSGVMLSTFGGGGTVYSVTVAQSYLLYGYTGAAGSVSPSTLTNNGATISELAYSYSTGDLYLSLTGTYSKTAFTQLIVGGVSYTSASATFMSGSTTTWSWVASSNPFSSIGSVVPVTIT